MVDLVAGGLMGLVGGAGALWEYNQGNWQFDKAQRQNQVHQLQNMRCAQAQMFREDIRDLFGLTIAKMDSYLTVNTLQLGFAINLFYDGALFEVAPTWIFSLYALSVAASLLFFVLSMWFSVYASIAAQSCTVRCLTQALRVPIPRIEEYAHARAYATDYESEVTAAFRVPFLQKHKAGRKKPLLQVLTDGLSDLVFPTPAGKGGAPAVKSAMKGGRVAASAGAAGAGAAGQQAAGNGSGSSRRNDPNIEQGTDASGGEGSSSTTRGVTFRNRVSGDGSAVFTEDVGEHYINAANSKPKSKLPYKRSLSASGALLKRSGTLARIGADNGQQANFHFHYFDEFQDRWRGFDTLARILMGMGTYHLLQSTVYYACGWFVYYKAEYLGGMIYMFLLTCVQYLLTKLELYFSKSEEFKMALLIFAPPALAFWTSCYPYTEDRESGSFGDILEKVVPPLILFLHMWFYWLLLWLSPAFGEKNVTSFRATQFTEFLTSSAATLVREKQSTLDLFHKSEEKLLVGGAIGGAGGAGGSLATADSSAPTAAFSATRAGSRPALTRAGTKTNMLDKKFGKRTFSRLDLADDKNAGEVETIEKIKEPEEAFAGAAELELRLACLVFLFTSDYVVSQLDELRIDIVTQVEDSFEESRAQLSIHFPDALRPRFTDERPEIKLQKPALEDGSGAGNGKYRNLVEKLKDEKAPPYLGDLISDDHSWLEMFYYSDRGIPMPYYVSPAFEETSWERPAHVDRIPNLFTLKKAAMFFVDHVNAACQEKVAAARGKMKQAMAGGGNGSSSSSSKAPTALARVGVAGPAASNAEVLGEKENKYHAKEPKQKQGTSPGRKSGTPTSSKTRAGKPAGGSSVGEKDAVKTTHVQIIGMQAAVPSADHVADAAHLSSARSAEEEPYQFQDHMTGYSSYDPIYDDATLDATFLDRAAEAAAEIIQQDDPYANSGLRSSTDQLDELVPPRDGEARRGPLASALAGMTSVAKSGAGSVALGVGKKSNSSSASPEVDYNKHKDFVGVAGNIGTSAMDIDDGSDPKEFYLDDPEHPGQKLVHTPPLPRTATATSLPAALGEEVFGHYVPRVVTTEQNKFDHDLPNRIFRIGSGSVFVFFVISFVWSILAAAEVFTDGKGISEGKTESGGAVAFPGGKGEKEESLLETCLREVREEVGVDLAKQGTATTPGVADLAHFVCALDPILVGKRLNVHCMKRPDGKFGGWRLPSGLAIHCLVFEIVDSDAFRGQVRLQESEVQAAGWFDLSDPSSAKPAELRTDLTEHLNFKRTEGAVQAAVEEKIARLFGLSEAVFAGQALVPKELFCSGAAELSNPLQVNTQGQEPQHGRRKQTMILVAKSGSSARGGPSEKVVAAGGGINDNIILRGWNPRRIRRQLAAALGPHFESHHAKSSVDVDNYIYNTRHEVGNETGNGVLLPLILLWGLTQQLLDMVILRTKLPPPKAKIETVLFNKYRFPKRFGSAYHDVMFGMLRRVLFFDLTEDRDRHWLEVWQRYFRAHVVMSLLTGGWLLDKGWRFSTSYCYNCYCRPDEAKHINFGAIVFGHATARASRLLTSSQIYERGDVEVDVQHEDGSPAATAFSAASALELAEHESQYETEHEAEGLEEKPCKETGSAGGQPMTVSPEIDKQIADAEAGRPRKPSSTKKPAAKKATATTAPPPKGDTISMEAYAKAYADTCLIHQSFANVGLAAVILSVLSIFAVPIVCIVK
eukprot:g10064.t1